MKNYFVGFEDQYRDINLKYNIDDLKKNNNSTDTQGLNYFEKM